jgi:hypothetical protein
VNKTKKWKEPVYVTNAHKAADILPSSSPMNKLCAIGNKDQTINQCRKIVPSVFVSVL